MNLTLNVWRQPNANAPGRFVTYPVNDISPDMSFLEMLDIVNEGIVHQGEDPIAFDSDCREGICGICGIVINGIPHGGKASTTCQLYMRHFREGETLTLEPFRARPFPVLKDLIVDRTALDRIMSAGGFISASVGSAPDGNDMLVPKNNAEAAMNYAVCIGCGACAAACPNGSAMLFTGAKVAHMAELPQGQPERYQRVVAMLSEHDELGFGSCTNHGECSAVCPAHIPMSAIARINRELTQAALRGYSSATA
ncbi:MAG: succinate dehydrogenase/fumarate reductase iron-sulfur subunit [Anaerolineae bacterium]|mgnify:CR=1 FL=1|nr:succinate dehydrogenase/fumarate reductase iron-sulfur subunit [Anaerolineae bacterium]